MALWEKHKARGKAAYEARDFKAACAAFTEAIREAKAAEGDG